MKITDHPEWWQNCLSCGDRQQRSDMQQVDVKRGTIYFCNECYDSIGKDYEYSQAMDTNK